MGRKKKQLPLDTENILSEDSPIIDNKDQSKKSLIKARPYLVVLFLAIGMLLTPPDVFSQLFLAVAMWVLFEIGIIFSKNK